MKYRDLYFNPGSRLRISVSARMWLWIRWGWRAEWQFVIRRARFSWYNKPNALHIECGLFVFSHYR